MNTTLKTTLRSFVALSFAGVLMALTPACGTEECLDGQQCTCTDSSCTQSCDSDTGAGCNFDCEGDNCSNICTGGGCSMTCRAKSCALDCPGGGCSLTCNGADSCQITSCTNSCQLSCNGAGTCSSSCDPLNGGCVVSE